MPITIEEGRLIEAPTPGATGVERRAFGEFVSRHGEMASYAIGWATDADPAVGRITIGIGAGNPGGATFHAVVFADDEGHAFSLVDEPFEDVPEGGPDLTKDEALAHDTLEFIWFVADTVMARDRRAWWMSHWLRGTVAFQTPQISDRSEPVVLVFHDDDEDGERDVWQLIGTTDPGSDGHVSHLYHAVDADPTLCEILDLEPGYSAEREGVGAPWTRRTASA